MRVRVNYYLDAWQVDAMKGIMTKDGVLVSEQIRRAITAWLKDRGVTEPKRKTTKGRA